MTLYPSEPPVTANRDYGTGSVLFEERNQRLHQGRLKPVVVWEMSDSMRRLPVRSTVELVQGKRAAEINVDSRHFKSDSLCGEDPVMYLGLAIER